MVGKRMESGSLATPQCEKMKLKKSEVRRVGVGVGGLPRRGGGGAAGGPSLFYSSLPKTFICLSKMLRFSQNSLKGISFIKLTQEATLG